MISILVMIVRERFQGIPQKTICEMVDLHGDGKEDSPSDCSGD